jgi:hypothetical protein
MLASILPFFEDLIRRVRLSFAIRLSKYELGSTGLVSGRASGLFRELGR